MPIYEYRCEDCQAVLELFQHPGDPSPKLCGYRCALGRDDDQDLRGSGLLARQISAPQGIVRSEMMGDRPTEAQIKRAGFTTFHNEGTGLRRSAGDMGPKWIDAEEKKP